MEEGRKFDWKKTLIIAAVCVALIAVVAGVTYAATRQSSAGTAGCSQGRSAEGCKTNGGCSGGACEGMQQGGCGGAGQCGGDQAGACRGQGNGAGGCQGKSGAGAECSGDCGTCTTPCPDGNCRTNPAAPAPVPAQ